jgi:hypothetical protein
MMMSDRELGMEFGRLLQKRRDQKIIDEYNRMIDPFAYRTVKRSYKGLGAKRRLYMKAKGRER